MPTPATAPTTPAPQAGARWYDIKALSTGEGQPSAAAIYIYGDIGESWWEETTTAKQLVPEIAALDVDQINLHINSYGGSVPDGLAIYNALKRHRASVHVHIDGVAVSCASYIAMAGDTVTMARNAQMMIHAPWTYGSGNAVQLRELADDLDRYANAMAHAYADKSGKSYDDALALLTDGVDHWLLADEAQAEGFADEVTDAEPVAAALAASFAMQRFAPRASAAPAPAAPTPRFATPPALAAGNPQEHSMPTTTTPAAPVNAAPAAAQRTSEDNAAWRAMCAPFASRAGVQQLQLDVLTDPTITLDQARAQLLAELGRDVTPATPAASAPQVETVSDEADKRRAAMAQAILAKAGQLSAQERATLGSNPYRGKRLAAMAEDSLKRAGVRTDGMDEMEIVAQAMHAPRAAGTRVGSNVRASGFTQGTSDFPIVLENVMHKTLQAAYAVAADTWRSFCAEGSVSDFRAHTRYRLGSLGNLDAKTELDEYVNKAIPDAERSSIAAKTKGNIINISREALVNDDLGAFVGLAAMLGRAAARTIEADVYALLALNGGQGPTLADGYALFSSQHGNHGTTGTALAVASLDAARVMMAQQKDVSGNDYLDLRPDVLLVPVGLGGTARVLINAQYDPDTANKLQKPNIVNGLVSNVVDTPRLAGAGYYLFANPSDAPVIEVAFLNGESTPYLETESAFDTDGARYKVRLDFGIAAIDYRGGVYCTGAGA